MTMIGLGLLVEARNQGMAFIKEILQRDKPGSKWPLSLYFYIID